MSTETAVPARRAARQVSLNKRPPAETALQATARAVDATRITHPRPRTPHVTASLRSELHPVRSLYSSHYYAQIAGRHRGGHEDATEHDTDQNLACRPAAASQGLGGHARAACQRRDNGPRGYRRAGHTRHRGNGEAAGRG